MKDKIIIIIKIINSYLIKSEKQRSNDFGIFSDQQIETIYNMFVKFAPDLTDEVLVRIENEVKKQWNRHHETYWKIRDVHSCFYIGIRKSIPRYLEQYRDESPWIKVEFQTLLEAADEASMKLFKEPMTFQAGTLETLERWCQGMDFQEWQEIVGTKLKFALDKKVDPIERWNLIADVLHKRSKTERAEFAPFVKIEKFGITQK
jgi:hypothetical protein